MKRRRKAIRGDSCRQREEDKTLMGTFNPRYARQLLKALGLDLTAEQDEAIRYLESQGLVFLVHFGYGNAIRKARQHFEDADTAGSRPS